VSGERLSDYERRRRAPLHYEARATNARFAAYVLWNLDGETKRRNAERIGYGGTPSGALAEACFREKALALELIIKAVIAQRIEGWRAQSHVVRVRPTHNLITLWEDAELPRLPPDDQYRLMIARRALIWSGRYPAPKTDEDGERERKEMAPLAERPDPGSRPKGVKLRSFDWDDFDRIYQIAATAFWALHSEVHPLDAI
jgi:hypothetical protein